MEYFGSILTPGIILWFSNRAALARIDHKAGCAYAQPWMQAPPVWEFCAQSGVEIIIKTKLSGNTEYLI